MPAKNTSPNIHSPSFLNPFNSRPFMLLWVATVIADIGVWMYNAAVGWLMTSLNPHPLMVSLVQAVASLPMFLFALPAGALADIIDKRRFILFFEILITLVSVAFAVQVSTNLATAWTLLLFLFSSSTLSALEIPAWQSIVPELVPRDDLSAAVAANSVGVNISRAVGPALAGVFLGPLSSIAAVKVMMTCRRRERPARSDDEKFYVKRRRNRMARGKGSDTDNSSKEQTGCCCAAEPTWGN